MDNDTGQRHVRRFRFNGATPQAEVMDQSPKILPVANQNGPKCTSNNLIEMLQEMFGEDFVPKIFKGEKLYVTVDGKRAHIDLLNLEVTSKEDETFQQIVQTCDII